MAGLPYILLNSKQYFAEHPKHYIRTISTEYSQSPPERMEMIDQSDLSALLKINNIEISTLIPKIQFFKVYTDKNTGKISREVYIPYSYDAKNYIENIFGNRQFRGEDVGIRNVTFVYDNQNPSVAETLLGCQIQFVFDNAEALVLERPGGFRYADLFSFRNTDANDKVNRGKYDIILKVGYEVDGTMDVQSQEVRDALKKQERMVRLAMVSYNLNFQANGKLTVDVDYKSANVDYFSDRRNEVLGANALLKKKGDKDNGRDAKADQTGDKTKQALDLSSLYSTIQSYMEENQMIHTFDAKLVDKIIKGDYYFSPCANQASGLKNDFKEDISSQLISVKSTMIPPPEGPRTPGSRKITYFYFGDLIESILTINEEVFEQMKSRRFAILMDNVAYQFMKGDQISVFNIAKLPISQESFNDWFQKTIANKNIKMYSLMAFLKSSILDFVSSILGTKTQDQVGVDYTPRITRQVIVVPDGLEDNKEIFGTTKMSPLKSKSSYAKNAKDSYCEYYTIYDEKYYNDKSIEDAERAQKALGGDIYYYNLARGVPHFYIGADKGLLKKFSFQKSNISEGLVVVRNMEEGNPNQDLWSIFDISADFIGNNLMTVGKNIYLDPTITGLGSPFNKNTVASIMGLGGYYMVTKVSHSYYPKWVTTISAIQITPVSQQNTYASQDLSFIYY